MMSFIRFRYSTMAIVVFASWALMCSQTLASASSSKNQRILNPKCEDNPDFRFKRSKSKDCKWVGKNPKRKTRLCRGNKKVRKNCQETCGRCKGDSVVCPTEIDSKIFDAEFCNGYQDGLECGYNHFYTGCSTDDMICTPIDIYTCSMNGEGKQWSQISIRLIPCTTSDTRPYGESCDPKECPPAAPLEGAPCSWYKGGSQTCGYEPKWYGCTEDELKCENTMTYECDPFLQTWFVATISVQECFPDYGLPQGKDCDPSNPVIPVLESCPDTKPEENSGCQPTKAPACLYGHKVLGCDTNSLQCTPTVSYTCGKDYKWKEEVLPQIECISEDPQWGQDCDPSNPVIPVCPDTKPEENSWCHPAKIPPCLYGHKVLGCDTTSLRCTPTVSYTCGTDYKWKGEVLPQIECISEDPQWGRDCDPTTVIPT